jgi:two-component system, OmpR family, sensor histidine kinase KdpD
VDVAALVHEVAETLSEDPNGDLITVTAPGPAFASVDAPHLRGAITNILRNAIAYSAPGRDVRVTVERHEDRITVIVKNRGSFIPETERTSIFDPFVRGSLGRAQSGSTGLGLFIARRVVEAHGGEIWVESNRRQSTFGLQLPTGTARARRSAS